MSESVLGYSQKELDKIPNYILYIKMMEEINKSIQSTGEMVFDLNKTLTRIDDSLRIIARK
jgi:hypothetical protein|tara:strand:+ start:230 stop:412 length:183 start_codon:yes stop_codon:yes gene_type:complete